MKHKKLSKRQRLENALCAMMAYQFVGLMCRDRDEWAEEACNDDADVGCYTMPLDVDDMLTFPDGGIKAVQAHDARIVEAVFAHVPSPANGQN